MRELFYRLSAALLVLLLLAGCGAGAEGSSPAETPEVSGPATEEAVGADEAARLDDLALLYEKYCFGRALSGEDTVDAHGGVAFGLLYQNGLLDPYWNETYEYWEIPTPLLEGINRYFFQNLLEVSQWDQEQYHLISGGGEVDLGFSLVREEARRLSDGCVEVTYRRVREDQVLTPVTYRFRPYTLEEFPDVLEGICQPGETLYLYISVTQRPDLLPEDRPQTIEIATADELLAAARRINEGGYETRHDTYLLTADIDLTGVEWTPMGLGNRVMDFYNESERDPNLQGFNGTFDGQGHTIYNFTVTEERGAEILGWPERNFPDRSLSGVGFFYRVGAEGVVKNLRMENASVSVPVEGEENYSAAAILAVECMGRLESVSVQGKVRGVQETGGLVGTLSGVTDIVYLLDGSFETGAVAENCSAEVEVSGYTEIGGLAGSLHYGILKNCTASGTVTAIYAGRGALDGGMPAGIGGLVGHSVQGAADNCGASVYVSTQLPSRWVGGFGGYWQSGYVTSCRVDGEKTDGWEPVGFFYNLWPETPEIETSP